MSDCVYMSLLIRFALKLASKEDVFLIYHVKPSRGLKKNQNAPRPSELC